MAILDWPTAPGFKPNRLRFGLSAPRSEWGGFYTGQVQSIAHFATRLRAEMTLPPLANAVDMGYRESFLLQLAARGDWVRLGPFLRSEPTVKGTMRGSPTVNSDRAAGTTVLPIANATAADTLLREVEQFAGPAWTVNGPLTVTINTDNEPFDGAARADTLQDTSAAATAWLSQSVTVADDGANYTGSIYVLKTSGGTAPTFALELLLTGGGTPVTVFVRINTDSGVVLGGTGSSASISGGTWWRVSVPIANNSTGNTTLDYRLFPARSTTGSGGATNTATGSAVVWGAQLEPGATLGQFRSKPTLVGGDMLAIGSQLIEVGYVGVTQTNATTLQVPLAIPLRSAVTAGAAVTWFQPAGNFQLQDDLTMVEYLPGRYQDAITLSFVEAY